MLERTDAGAGPRYVVTTAFPLCPARTLGGPTKPNGMLNALATIWRQKLAKLREKPDETSWLVRPETTLVTARITEEVGGGLVVAADALQTLREVLAWRPA